MRNNKTLSLLAKIQAHDRQFRRFLNSPYFNTNEDMIRLYLVIRDGIGKVREKDLEWEYLWEMTFPKTPFNRKKMQRTLRKLRQLGEEFFVQLSLKQDSLVREKLLLRAFLKNDLSQHLESRLNKVRKEEAITELQDDRSILFQLESIFMEVSDQIRNSPSREAYSEILKAQRVLDLFYCIHSLRLIAVGQSQGNTFGTPTDLPPETSQLLEKATSDYAKHKLVQFYVKLIRLQKSQTPAEVDDLLESFQLMRQSLDHDENLDIFAMLHNSLVLQANQYGLDSNSHFQFYRWAEKNGAILQDNGKIPSGLYKNMIRSCLLVNEVELARIWAERYKKHLPEHSSISQYNFCLAQLDWTARSYSKAVKRLHNVAYDDGFVGLAARRLLMQCYYELNYHEPLHALVQSFTMYLRETRKLKSYHIKAYRDFLQTFRILMRKPRVETLQNAVWRVKANSNHLDQEWFLEKLGELLGLTN